MAEVLKMGRPTTLNLEANGSVSYAFPFSGLYAVCDGTQENSILISVSNNFVYRTEVISGSFVETLSFTFENIGSKTQITIISTSSYARTLTIKCIAKI